MWVEIEAVAFKRRCFRARRKLRKRTASELYYTSRNKEPRAPPSLRRVAGNTWQRSAAFSLVCKSHFVSARFFTVRLWRAAEDKTLSARRSGQSVCAHCKFIIQRASHTQAESRSHMLKQEKPPQNPTVALSQHCCLLFISVLSSAATKTQSKWRLGAHRPRWSLLSRPDLLLSSRCHRFTVRVCRAGAGICETRCICVGLRDAFAYSLRRRVRSKSLWKGWSCWKELPPALAAALSRRGCWAAVHLLCYCICLIMHVNTVEMHSPADQ